jgi:hypothetical protein
MVAGYVAALGSIDRHREAIRGFVATTCAAGGRDPYQSLAILVQVASNVGQSTAAEIAGPEWVDRHVGRWTVGDLGRTRAEDKWRERGTAPPHWPFTTLDDGGFVVWVAPFDGLPAHLTWLWNDAKWLDSGQWQTRAPDRPAGSMPCVVQVAGHWRVWMPAPAPKWSLQAWQYWRGIVAIATGIMLSAVWTVYADWMNGKAVGNSAWLVIAVTIALWIVPLVFFVRRAGWARRACRVLAALTVVGTLVSLITTSGSAFFYAVGSLRILVFALAVLLLKPSSKQLP